MSGNPMSVHRLRALLAAAAAVVLATAGCAGWGGGVGGGGADSINVLMVNNPQMIDLQRLTAGAFTKDTGIRVNFTVLPENDVRDKISQEFSSQAGQYDVASLSNFEIPIYAKSKWIAPLDGYVQADTAFDQADILPPMTQSLTADDGKLYGEPFYGESSFLMYRKDLFEKAGIKVNQDPNYQPKWDEVAQWAETIKEKNNTAKIPIGNRIRASRTPPNHAPTANTAIAVPVNRTASSTRNSRRPSRTPPRHTRLNRINREYAAFHSVACLGNSARK